MYFFSAGYHSTDSTTSYKGEVPISHNEQESSRKSVAAGSGGATAGGASVAFYLRRSSIYLLYFFCLRKSVCGYHFCAVEVSSRVLLQYKLFLTRISGEVMAARDTRNTVDADHPTRTLTLTRTPWGDLCFDAK